MGGDTISITAPIAKHSSNNIAELRAGHVAFVVAHAFKSMLPYIQALFLADSLLVVNHIQLGWNFPEDMLLATIVRKFFKKNFQSPIDELYWIRGHDEIDGNECADTAAKTGAKSPNSPNTVTIHWPIALDSTLYDACDRALRLAHYTTRKVYKYPP